MAHKTEMPVTNLIGFPTDDSNALPAVPHHPIIIAFVGDREGRVLGKTSITFAILHINSEKPCLQLQ